MRVMNSLLTGLRPALLYLLGQDNRQDVAGRQGISKDFIHFFF
jgi:hypothetical protein